MDQHLESQIWISILLGLEKPSLVPWGWICKGGDMCKTVNVKVQAGEALGGIIG